MLTDISKTILVFFDFLLSVSKSWEDKTALKLSPCIELSRSMYFDVTRSSIPMNCSCPSGLSYEML